MGTSLPPVGVQFQAQGVPQVQGAFRAVNNEATRFTALQRQSFTAVNATGFAISQFATGGQVGFRSLAASATGFLSFFGGAGLIAAAVVSTGLILSDFWSRQKREAEEAKKALGDLAKEASERERRDDPTIVPKLKLAEARKDIAALDVEIARVVGLRNEALARHAGSSEDARQQATFQTDKRLAELREQRLALLNRETEGLRQLNDANAKVAEDEKKRREDAARAAKELSDAAKAAERERQARIAAQVSNFKMLEGLGKLTTENMRQALLLERQLQAELARTNENQYARRTDLLQQIAALSALSIRPIGTPSVGMMSGDRSSAGRLLPFERATAGRNGSATSLELPIIPEATPAEKSAARARMQSAFDAAEMVTLEQTIAQGLGNAIANGIAGGFAIGLGDGGLGEGFKSMTSQMLAGFGNMAIEAGFAQLQIAQKMAGWATALAELNPWVAIGLAVATIAIGQKLGGRGRSGGGFSGFGGGIGSSASNPIDIRRLVVDPNFRQPIKAAAPLQPVEVIGLDTPRVGRAVAVAVGRSNNRGIR